MTKAFLSVLSLIVLAGCTAQVGEPQAADDSVSSSSDALSTSVAIGATLVTTDYLNLRTGPGTTYSVIEVIPAGARVSAVNRTSPDNGFYNIVFGDKVGWSSGVYLKTSSPPSSHTLDTAFVSTVVEPLGSGKDDEGTSYYDKNYWNFCAPGAVTAAVSFFTPKVASWPAGTFEEPYGPYRIKTYWGDERGRAFLMHVAMQSDPPDFTEPGLPSFSTYPTRGSGLGDIRDVLNWEASGHASTWSTFFYQRVSASGLSSATLHADVARDIWGGHAVVATVNTSYLPNWSRSLGHAIAIVGYDDGKGTYEYVDTCGKACNGSAQATNGGVWQISQTKMHSAITSLGAGYAR